jgi:hypothetical protein
MAVMSKQAIRKLSVAQRQALLETICEVMSEERNVPPISDAELELIRERLSAYERAGKPGKPIEQFMQELDARRK